MNKSLRNKWIKTFAKNKSFEFKNFISKYYNFSANELSKLSEILPINLIFTNKNIRWDKEKYDIVKKLISRYVLQFDNAHFSENFLHFLKKNSLFPLEVEFLEKIFEANNFKLLPSSRFPVDRAIREEENQEIFAKKKWDFFYNLNLIDWNRENLTFFIENKNHWIKTYTCIRYEHEKTIACFVKNKKDAEFLLKKVPSHRNNYLLAAFLTNDYIDNVTEVDIDLLEPKYYTSRFVNSILSKSNKIIFDFDIISKFENIWNWNHLVNNKNISWDIQTIDKYKDRLPWKIISESDNVKWTGELIDKFKDNWDWDKLSRNKHLPWSIELLRQFKSFWEWNGIYGGIGSNESIPWNIEIIKEFEHKLYWKTLSGNPALPWSVKFIKLFNSKIHFEQLSTINSPFWNDDILTQFKDKWDWEQITVNSSIEFDLNRLNLFKNKIKWKSIRRSNVIWSIEILHRFSKEISKSNNGIDQLFGIIPFYQLMDDYVDSEMIVSNLFGTHERCRDKVDILLWSFKLGVDYEQNWFWYQLLDFDIVWEIQFNPYVNENNIIELSTFEIPTPS